MQDSGCWVAPAIVGAGEHSYAAAHIEYGPSGDIVLVCRVHTHDTAQHPAPDRREQAMGLVWIVAACIKFPNPELYHETKDR